MVVGTMTRLLWLKENDKQSVVSEDFKRSEMEKLNKVGELQGFDYDYICEVIEVLEKQGFVVTDNDLSETNWNSYNILKKRINK